VGGCESRAGKGEDGSGGAHFDSVDLRLVLKTD
jgi:hypothetical protein